MTGLTRERQGGGAQRWDQKIYRWRRLIRGYRISSQLLLVVLVVVVLYCWGLHQTCNFHLFSLKSFRSDQRALTVFWSLFLLSLLLPSALISFRRAEQRFRPNILPSASSLHIQKGAGDAAGGRRWKTRLLRLRMSLELPGRLGAASQGQDVPLRVATSRREQVQVIFRVRPPAAAA